MSGEMTSILKLKRPSGPGWVELPPPPAFATLGYPSALWFFPEAEITVISAIEVAKDKDDTDRGPEYHISISKLGQRRCDFNEALFVVNAFDMVGAEEDNHVPHGFVRNFWRPVADGLVGLECGCKEKEPEIREDKGDFIWRPNT